MIEKLDILNNTVNVFTDNNFVANVASGADTIDKINELVEVVNVLQAQVAILEEHAHPTAKTEPTDPYAEQRKWIGKLCWFWDEDREDAFCDILGYVFENSKYPYVQTDSSNGYKCCEPVKSNEDIIYKGE